MINIDTGLPLRNTALNTENPNHLYHHMIGFLQYRMVNHYSETTVAHNQECLIRFIRWCDDRHLETPQDITSEIIERYKAHLFHHRKKNGKPLTHQVQRGLVGQVRCFFRYLAKQHIILFNPAADIDMPRISSTLPKDILTPEEMALLLGQPDTHTHFGIRDRAILETLYATGIRRLECVNLQVTDIDHSRETLFIRQGKGNKDRLVPLSKQSLTWLNRYLDQIRPVLIMNKNSNIMNLFLGHSGKALSKGRLSDLVSNYINSTNIGKTGSTHLIRHSMATHMLDNGADTRFIQSILGHADLGTTQIYTKVAIGQLKKVYDQTHPAQKTQAA